MTDRDTRIRDLVKEAKRGKNKEKNKMNGSTFVFCEMCKPHFEQGQQYLFKLLGEKEKEYRDAIFALKAFKHGFRDGDIKWTKRRMSDNDPYHKANILMCEVLEKYDARSLLKQSEKE